MDVRDPSVTALPPELAAHAPLFVVLNPGSGQQSAAEDRERIAAVFAAAGRPHQFIPVDGDVVAACRRAAQLARRCGGILVASGGDGTLNAAAHAAMNEGCPLGAIPAGTFNLFGREYRLPTDAAEAALLVVRGRATPVQVGIVNQQCFLVNASLGLYPQVLEDREALKRKLGMRRRWIAILSAVGTLIGWNRRLTLELERDGWARQLRTPTLFVCNNRLQLERLGMEEDLLDAVDHGHIAAIVAHPHGPWAKLRLAVRAMIGALGDSEEVDGFAFRSMTVDVRGHRRVKLALDGEVMAVESPVRFSVSPRPLLLMLPPDGAGNG